MLQCHPVRGRVGPYAIYGEIASGGMASVHFARLLEPAGVGHTVAVKRAHPHLAKEADFALMFFDEARLASRILHPNVVRTLDVLNTPDDLALVMEYIHGESLWKLMRTAHAKGERVPGSVAVKVVSDTLRGLHAAHEATDENGAPLGLVHRDVSPQNVIVGADGGARIVDFGIAKAAGRLHSTRDSSVKGKYAYMSPEQVRGEGVSRLTDTYAAGIILWELLTGERLFAGKNEAETIHKCLVARVQAPSLFTPDVGAALDGVVKRAVAREPARRYATALEMAEELASKVAPAHPAEVAAWVQRLAGEALAERAGMLREIEAGEMRREAATLPDAGPPPSQPSAQLLEPHRPEPSPRRSRRLLFGGLLLTSVVGATAGATLVLGRTAPAPMRPEAPLVTKTIEAPKAPEPVSVAAAPPPPASDVPVTALPIVSTAPAPSAPPSASSARPAARPWRVGAPLRPSRPARVACDPPYSVDGEGRKIFKPECM